MGWDYSTIFTSNMNITYIRRKSKMSYVFNQGFFNNDINSIFIS